MGGGSPAREGWFGGTGGVELHERRWPVDDGDGSVLVVHGYGEQCGRYDRFAERLNAVGYSVYAYDHRGHGKSPGRRGHIGSFDDLTGDLKAYLAHIRPETDGAPFFVFGHSMGGLVLGHVACAGEVEARGLVFSGAAVKVSADVAPLMQKISGIVAAVAPHFPVHWVDPSAISREEAEVEMYRDDPLVYHGKMGARTGHELLTAAKRIQGVFDRIKQPLFVLHGTADGLVECAASELLHGRAGSADKTLRLYEGAYHEVFNDLDREAFYSDLIGWLHARRTADGSVMEAAPRV